MPELPEVEVVRRGLEQHAVGRTVATAAMHSLRVARRHVAGGEDLAARLVGQRLASAQRRGKYLWLVLEPSLEALVIHLGMSGQVLVTDRGAPARRHQHATLTFTDGGPDLAFVDQRTFGGLALTELVPDVRGARAPRAYGVPGPVAHIACDPLEPAFDQAAVVLAMRRRQSAVKRALLDQSLVSGIGNIYADEALWRAGVHGQRLCADLTKPRLARILERAREVMLAALEQGGTSFDATYVNVNGTSGYFDRSLSAYGQTGRPCPRCGTPIRREAFMNRSSHSCPRCQPRPRYAPR
ncbi:MAG: bifunctional DNA-formamidopyrimidine glycosylase/DNA-(apurinic or apyrimidinic site) lyase [Austwickia sp.]|jgi:formamidopyrimidine-DNA glycosylase|nr:MAG: bifunctional DNA-formamidopyrimidine glycosylase/DNA-(apurinic or apyrimidinic site) lyase [Austwickia sp.]